MNIFRRFTEAYDGLSLSLDISFVVPNHVNIHAVLFIFEWVLYVYVCILYSGADKSLARPGRKQATFPAFYGTWRFITTFTKSTTCPYPSQINPFLCPSHFWEAQLASFLVGLRTYQHLGKFYIWSGYKRLECLWANKQDGSNGITVRLLDYFWTRSG